MHGKGVRLLNCHFEERGVHLTFWPEFAADLLRGLKNKPNSMKTSINNFHT